MDKKIIGSKKITIFTPTYNRAYVLGNLYESLKRQRFKDFEWVIVDDGSEDGTKEIVQTWIKENNEFPIRYYYQVNGGKCRAINRGLDLAEGELFFTVDSDDCLTDDALDKVLMWEKHLYPKEKFCGIAGNLGTDINITPNNRIKEPYFEGSALDRYQEIDGERAMVFYTEIHRKYKYPEYAGETFMTEAVAWNRMAADGYKMRFYNDIIWIYEYKEDGLTKAGSKLFLENPHGYGIWLKEKAIFQKATFIERLKLYYSFTCELAELYRTELIADCIGTNKVVIELAKIIYMIRKKIRGK